MIFLTAVFIRYQYASFAAGASGVKFDCDKVLTFTQDLAPMSIRRFFRSEAIRLKTEVHEKHFDLYLQAFVLPNQDQFKKVATLDLLQPWVFSLKP